MTSMRIFSIFDAKLDAYLEPFFSPTTATGVRMFEATCQNPQSDFARFPQDYSLFEVGVFFPDGGRIEVHEAKIPLGVAVEYVNRAPMENGKLEAL